MLDINPQTIELLEHLRLNDTGDPWHQTMSLGFAVCDYMHIMGEDVPAELQYSPGMGLNTLEDWKGDDNDPYMCDLIEALSEDDRQQLCLVINAACDYMREHDMAY